MTDSKGVVVRKANWPEDTERLRDVRRRVFIEEQGVPEEIEWDGQDADALHVLCEKEGATLGCGRLLADGRIGRLAVLPTERGKRYGERLLNLLLELAQARGDAGVYLHAQADAEAFYLRADFERRGLPFLEAAIEHVDMQLEFDYRDWDRDLVQLRAPQPFRQLVVAQARLAGRELRILSPRLDPRLFDNEDFLSAARSLIRRGRMSRIQIIVQDPRAIVQRGHGLLDLARRMPSGIEVRRLAEHPLWNADTEVIRDRDSLLALPAGENSLGFYRPNSRARAEGALSRFEDLWHAGEVDPEFRALAL